MPTEANLQRSAMPSHLHRSRQKPRGPQQSDPQTRAREDCALQLSAIRYQPQSRVEHRALARAVWPDQPRMRRQGE